MRRVANIFFALLVAVICSMAWSVKATAAEPNRDDYKQFSGDTVIAIDAAVANSMEDIDVAETALRLVESYQSVGSLAVFVYSGIGNVPVRLVAGSEQSKNEIDSVVSQLMERQAALPSLQFPALGTMVTYLYEIDAPRGSRGFLITNGNSSNDSAGYRERLESFAQAFATEGWELNTVMVPSSSPEHRALLAKIATISGGLGFDGGTANGLAEFATVITGNQARGSIESDLEEGSSALGTINVAPATDHISVTFIRESSSTDVRLFNPQGAEVYLNRTDVLGIATPNVVIVSVANPIAGTWRSQAVGTSGRILTGVSASNSLALTLVDQQPIPVGEEGVIQAVLTAAGDRESVPGTFVSATVRQPDGSTRIYRLTDNGLGADKKLGDGLFAATIDATDSQGVNDVVLELGWHDHVGLVRAEGTFQTEFFPVLKFNASPSPSTKPGELVVIGSLSVDIKGFPHLVTPDVLSVSVLTADREIVEARLEPSNPVENGKAWQFEIFAAPSTAGTHIVHATFDGKYLERNYQISVLGASEYVNVSTATIPAGVAPPSAGLFSVPTWIWSLLAISLAGVAVAAIVVTRKAVPYGYLYDDAGRMVVNFASLKRGILRRILFRDRVGSWEISGLQLFGGTFMFSKDQVVLRYVARRGQPSVRVNSKPAECLNRLGRDVWIGTAGNLITFANGPGTVASTPELADA